MYMLDGWVDGWMVEGRAAKWRPAASQLFRKGLVGYWGWAGMGKDEPMKLLLLFCRPLTGWLG